MQQVIKKPLISEKSFTQTGEGKFSFLADPDADKSLLKQLIEELYKVDVVKVNTANFSGKIKRTRGKSGKRVDFKKCIVTLKKGQKIALFDVESEEKKAETTNKKDVKSAKTKSKTKTDKENSIEGVTTKIKSSRK